MATGLPPPPINDQPGSFTWLEWYRKLRDYISTNGSVPWYIINFAGSNITDIATRDHDQLQNLDGGTAGEHYHLTAAQYAALTAGPHNNLSGLQGGTTSEYYHLTSAQYNAVAAAGAIRQTVTSSRTYYVRTDGSDSNNGLTNNSSGAFLTVQKAFDVLATLDGNGFNAIVQIADGTYTGTIVTKQCLGFVQITIQGNSSTPTNVTLTSSGTTISHRNTSFSLVVKDVSVTSTGATGIESSNNSVVTIDNIDLGSTAAGGQQLYAYNGGRIAIGGNYTISGGSGIHILIYTGGLVNGNSKTVTLTGTPNFSVAFIYMGSCGTSQIHGFTYSGSATGKRYDILQNAVCSTNGGGVNYFPGNVAGTTATGGVYV